MAKEYIEREAALEALSDSFTMSMALSVDECRGMRLARKIDCDVIAHIFAADVVPVVRCGEYGCALNGKAVDKLLRMKKAATNYDRIISKSPEELAEWMSALLEGCDYGGCPARKGCDSISTKTCVAHISGWLKQEEGNGNLH